MNRSSLSFQYAHTRRDEARGLEDCQMSAESQDDNERIGSIFAERPHYEVFVRWPLSVSSAGRRFFETNSAYPATSAS